jgi:hypothetical protein
MDFFGFKNIYIVENKPPTTMKTIKTYEQFVNKSVNEAFTITLEQLPKIGDIVDRVDWKEGEKIAFIDFKGIKNIPIQIANKTELGIETEKA